MAADLNGDGVLVRHVEGHDDGPATYQQAAAEACGKEGKSRAGQPGVDRRGRSLAGALQRAPEDRRRRVEALLPSPLRTPVEELPRLAWQG